jgi:hypothetical protein
MLGHTFDNRDRPHSSMERERERERVVRARPQDILLGFVGELLGLGDLREAAADGEPVLAAA